MFSKHKREKGKNIIKVIKKLKKNGSYLYPCKLHVSL